MRLQSFLRAFTKCISPLAVLGISIALVGSAQADPIVGRDTIKFSQLPMLDTTLTSDAGFQQSYHGHDDLSTAWSTYSGGTAGQPFQFTGYSGTAMSDDFADPLNSPVVHVKWWGSYLTGRREGVQKFVISFGESDLGEKRIESSQVVVRGPISTGSGTFTEREVYPNSVDGPIYEYNAELHLGKEFDQRANRLQTLSIAALVDIGPNQSPSDSNVIRWGWHTRDFTVKNLFASTSPSAISDRLVGVVAPSTNVYQLGDSAFASTATITPGMGGSFLMPVVHMGSAGGQTSLRYQPTSDGPLAVGQFRRDLAFELYTVPEPASVASVGIIIACLALARRRQSR